MALNFLHRSKAAPAGSFLNRLLAPAFERLPWRRSFCSPSARVITVLLSAALTLPVLAAQKIELSVDASKTGAKIDRNIFGQFAEHLGHGVYEGIWVGPDSTIPNTRGIRNDVVAALKAIKVPNVRWPGGCFADEYHWRKGIGPRPARGDAQSQLGRRDRAEHLRHARVHGLHRPDRQPRPTSRSTSAPARRRKPPSGWST